MESNRYDVVVVGAGLAGLTAAAAAVQQNLKAALVATGPGSFVLGPGWLTTADIARAGSAQELKEAIAFFCEKSLFAGCSLEGDLSTARPLPTLLGDFQRVALAPSSLWKAEPRPDTSSARSRIQLRLRGAADFSLTQLRSPRHHLAHRNLL
jgi:glycine/D-amino acid oxidase-like deaminating enzyme